MLERRPVFPHVIEINHQAGHILGSNVYLIYDRDEWLLIDIGYEDTVDEVIELIRALDFPFAHCRAIVATHADVDHVQGLAKAKQLLRTTVTAHPLAVAPLQSGDPVFTFAHVTAQGIQMSMPPVSVEQTLDEGDVLRVGGLELQVWATPGHTPCQLAFRLGPLLFSGDNIYRDGCVGAIERASRQRLAAVHRLADADSPQRRGVAAAQPRSVFPQGRPAVGQHHRPAPRLPAHGGLRDLRGRLAADGRVGAGAGGGPAAGLDAAANRSLGLCPEPSGPRTPGVRHFKLQSGPVVSVSRLFHRNPAQIEV